jgi:hypothetical protein
MKTIYLVFAACFALALAQTYTPRERVYYIGAVEVYISQATTYFVG